MRRHYEIRWTGPVGATLDEACDAGVRPGRPPIGGQHVRKRADAEQLLKNFFTRCGTFAAKFEWAHMPRIIEVQSVKGEG